MSEVSVLLKNIAKEIGKDEKIVQPFINILEDNFYDTIQSIKDLKTEDYEKWKFPKRISDMILQKTQEILQGQPLQAQNQQSNVQQQQTQQTNQVVTQQSSMVSEPTKQELLVQKLQDLQKSISTTQRYIDILNFIKKIISNIAANPQEQKFRRIKQSNQHFQMNFLPNKDALEFMYLNNFKLDEEGIALADQDLDLETLNLSIIHIDNSIIEATPSNFNPYQTYTSGNEVLCARNLAQKEGFVNYYEELQKLKAKRLQVMSQPVSDRKTRVFIQNQNQSRQMEMQNEAEVEENQLLREFSDQLKKMIQNLDKQQFSSKSKQEYEKLLKDPVYTKSLIRIKFPQNVILEGNFCPMETIKHVIDFVALNLENPEVPFYLFQSPPRQVFDKRFHQKTLDEMGCLPGAVFYFAIDNDPEFQKKFYLKTEFKKYL
ncbi:hypothetical protein ABPG74_021308 [Tetrahymena malaccensis]